MKIQQLIRGLTKPDPVGAVDFKSKKNKVNLIY